MTPQQAQIIQVSATVAAAREQLLGMVTPRGTVIDLENFTYTADFLGAAAIASNTTANVTFQTAANSDFLILYMVANGISNTLVNIAAANLFDLLQVRDTTADRDFYSTPAMIANVCGAFGTPFIMPESRNIWAKSQVQVTISNGRATTTQYQIGFVGLKVYYKGLPGSMPQ